MCNLQELNAVEQWGVPLYAFNVNVGISVPVAGFREESIKVSAVDVNRGAICFNYGACA